VLGRKGELEGAAREFAAAAELAPENPWIRNNLGAAWALLGRFDRAIPEFEAALALKPDYAEARRNLEDARRRAAGGGG
jgi:Flp pilus assembly protein TadD